MKERKIAQYRVSTPSSDGAGVNLRRIFWRKDTLDIDPFLMLDTFDSHNPNDYIRGFPVHPHRGIETFTYLISGEIIHKDSLGNKGTISSSEYQWMNSGSGILHEEMPQSSEHMLGFQLWINLPKEKKMSDPGYLEGNAENIPETSGNGYHIRVLSGTFDNATKTDLPGHIPVEIYDISLEPNTELAIPVKENHNAFISTLLGEITAANAHMEPKSAATFVDGDTIIVRSGVENARIMFFAGKPLNEPVAWGGSIVMNTNEELRTANQDLRNGTFVKHEIKI